jgi:hypothetical protein
MQSAHNPTVTETFADNRQIPAFGGFVPIGNFRQI